jgi:hypothetical protein
VDVQQEDWRWLAVAHDVFISYSTQDKAVADAACATLESRRIRCWIAPRDVVPGLSYAEALIDALNRSRIMVLVFSASANSSPQVMREVERAVNKGIPIIPFRIENVTPSKAMEYFLSAPHWLDALTPPLEKHLQRLADTVQALLTEVEKPSREDVEPEPPVIKPSTQAIRRKKTRLRYIVIGSLAIALVAVGVFFLVDWLGRQEEVPDDTLPTTSFTGALTSGTSLKGELTYPGEVHWYTFDGEAGDAVYIVLTEGTKSSLMYPWLGLLGPDGNAVYENYYSQSVDIDRMLPNTGSYTIRVRDHSLGTGPYVLSFSQLSKTNNPMSSGASIQGELEFPGEVHWYTFDAEAGDAVYIVLTEGTKSSPMYLWLGLLGPDGNAVYENYYSQSVDIDRVLPNTGRYTIRVRDHSLGTGPYVLSFSQLSKTNNPISSGVSIQGELEFPGEVHWYTFDAEAGDAVYIVLTEGTASSPMYPWLGLLGPDGNAVYENYYSQSVDIDRVLPSTGRYTIRVRDHALVGGPYTLSFSMLVEP